jgi:hypothetical protein
VADLAETIESPPAVELHQIGSAAAESGEWEVRFLLANRGADLLKLISARLPHGQFRGAEIPFDGSASLAPGESLSFAARVRCDEPPGPVTENAFVIFLVQWKSREWRIFARVRVMVDADGIPEAVTQSITTQKVGFSGVAGESARS